MRSILGWSSSFLLWLRLCLILLRSWNAFNHLWVLELTTERWLGSGVRRKLKTDLKMCDMTGKQESMCWMFELWADSVDKVLFFYLNLYCLIFWKESASECALVASQGKSLCIQTQDHIIGQLHLHVLCWIELVCNSADANRLFLSVYYWH